MRSILIFCLIIIVTSACNSSQDPKGSLFIIGGGKRPPEMISELIRMAGVPQKGHIVILPMASSEPDTAAFYAEKQFMEMDIQEIHILKVYNDSLVKSERDLIQNAALIYIPGGSQERFMSSIEETDLARLILESYNNGSMIAGTSAGAAVQSELMITGDQVLYPEYTGYFRSIETGNIIVKPGLSLLDGTIIDQHFIKRQRLNRLISAILDKPGFTGIGIDESTAIYVHNNKATVMGEGQVIKLECEADRTRTANGLQGVTNMHLSIYLPGESFDIPEAK